MNYQVFLPSPELAPYIRLYWSLSSDQAYIHHAMADACAEMIFHLDGQFEEILPGNLFSRSPLTGLIGPAQQARRFRIENGFQIFGVYLYPFSIPLIFDLPAAALTDEMPPLEDILHKNHRHLVEQIMLAGRHEERIAIMNRFFMERLQRKQHDDLPVFGAIRQIIQQKGLVDIQDLFKSGYLSNRQFERQFKKFAGLPAKKLARIARFQAATAMYGQDIQLTEMAYSLGYYDQSHFIHDFKSFSGVLPKDYFAGNTAASDWRE
ncbi:AraC family transcriptional regulator [Chitinophaga caeni]|uniref:AraC family transcriptional regulator n=1 Tax=Chitinophaga caeni TaxID=2029983 RepID=A0A291QVG2_9BACT|nr:helix-turn-helix domain-containing protein [Chitinophaga caeni]ATL48019.1 AraC family transcriptional regulator [Chitinophaga caeni]